MIGASMKSVSAICVLLIVASVVTAAGEKPPSWHAPTAVELGTSEEQQWRADEPHRYLVVTGDFDGDGKPDEAWLMVRSDGNAYALFVKLASQDAPQKLDEFADIKGLPVIGIKSVPPAEYPTACARGYDCAEDEPRFIHVTHPAIDYFHRDTSDRYYYWNDSRHAFAQAGITG